MTNPDQSQPQADAVCRRVAFLFQTHGTTADMPLDEAIRDWITKVTHVEPAASAPVKEWEPSEEQILRYCMATPTTVFASDMRIIVKAILADRDEWAKSQPVSGYTG